MKIITISREFGSGGRELGKRLSDLLNFDYYDKEIIREVAANKKMNENYVETVLENCSFKNIPLHFRCSFSGLGAFQKTQTKLLLEEKQVIEKIAELGRDFVIVGRNADVILKRYAPFNIFVCADMETKITRCMNRAERSVQLDRKEIERKIHMIDKNRAQSRDIVAGCGWGDKGMYHLILNTSEWEIKELVPAVVNFTKCWFEKLKNSPEI